MNKNHIHRIKAGFLLGLFVFLLGYQSAHQWNNPDKPQDDCSVSDTHLHSDPLIHDCDICDYNFNAHLVLANVGFIAPVFSPLDENLTPQKPDVQDLNQIPARAPPVA